MTATLPEIRRPDADDVTRFSYQVPELVRATGPVSYDYQFGRSGMLELVVESSWATPETLFAAANTLIAVDGDQLAGLAMAFPGAAFGPYKQNLSPLAPPLVAAGRLAVEDLMGLLERADHASYLNTVIPEDAYYLHAIATTGAWRSRGLGRRLLAQVVADARAAGYRRLQLDVLCDNPAVQFYETQGFETVVVLRSPWLSDKHGFPSEQRMSRTL